MSLPTPASVKFILREEPLAYCPRELKLDTPERINDFLKTVVATDGSFEAGKENLILICLDARLNFTGYSILSVGTLTETAAHPRDIFRAAILANACYFILAHNHPSGEVSPSRADEQMTRKVDEAAAIMGIRFLDHVIFSTGYPTPGKLPYYSFREGGFIR